MAWRDNLRTVTINGKKMVGATFRGVPFFVEGSERSGGRRTVVHEFPFRDNPFVEDLGRKARPFHVDGYVIGGDYLTQRDALLSALEDVAGPGQLSHPYYGTKRAICTAVQVHETKADGGMATFSIDFIEAPALVLVPTVQADPASAVSSSADTAHAAVKIQLVSSFSIAKLPSYALASAQTALAKGAGALQSTLAKVTSDAQELSSLTAQISVMTAQASALVRKPDTLYDAYKGAIVGLVNTIKAAPGAVKDALIATYGADLGAAVQPTTATRQRELANQLALTAALRRIVAIEAARLAPVVPYATIGDATAARDQVTVLLDDQAQSADDATYPALIDLRTQVARAVPGSAALASIVTVTRRVAVPSLLLAYQLYGAVDQEADILARNNVKHPGFIAGELHVLSDG